MTEPIRDFKEPVKAPTFIAERGFMFINDQYMVLSDTENNNWFFGAAGNAECTGVSNSALGFCSLSALTIGELNSALGSGSLAFLTDGSGNVAFGSDAGRFTPGMAHAATSMTDSIYIGKNARASAIDADNEIVIGTGAEGLGDNITVIGNASTIKTVLYGTVDVSSITMDGHFMAFHSEDYNWFFGNAGTSDLITGDSNTGVGHDSLSEINTGSSNVAVGTFALFELIDGSYNVAIGVSAGGVVSGGGAVTSCSNSVFIGANSEAHGGADDNTIVIGADSVGHGSNTTTIGNDETQSTYLFGDVYGHSFKIDGLYAAVVVENVEEEKGTTSNWFLANAGNLQVIGAGNVGIGYQALSEVSTGDYNAAIGHSALKSIVATDYAVGIGYKAGWADWEGGGLHHAVGSIFIGYDTRAYTGISENEIVIGHQGRGRGNNTVTLGNSSTTDNWLTGIIHGGMVDLSPTSALSGKSYQYKSTGDQSYNEGLYIGVYAQESFISHNIKMDGLSWTQDNATTPSWLCKFGTSTDNFIVSRSTAGSVSLTSLFSISSAGIVNALSGFKVNDTAVSGKFLRANGTAFIAGNIAAGDLPNLGTSGTHAKFGATGLSDSLLSETASGVVIGTGLYMGLGDAKGRLIWTDTTTDTAVFSTCNVGIGKTPAHPLDVQGIINAVSGFKVNDTAVAGKFLRADGTAFIAGDIAYGDVPKLVRPIVGVWPNPTTATRIPLIMPDQACTIVNVKAFCEGGTGLNVTMKSGSVVGTGIETHVSNQAVTTGLTPASLTVADSSCAAGRIYWLEFPTVTGSVTLVWYQVQLTADTAS